MAEKNVFGLGPLDTLLAEYQQGLADAPGLGAPQAPEQPMPKIDTRQPTQAPSRARGLLPPPDMVPLFEATSQKYDVPVNVLMALAQQESSYNPGVRGVATQYGRALGLMQYLPSTAKMMGINPFDAEQSIDAAARQLKERLDKGYSMEDAVREHFAGPDRRGWGPKTAQYGIDVLNKARQIGAQMYGEAPQAMPNLRRNPFLTEGNMSTRQDGPMSVPAGTDRRDLSMPNLPEAPDDSSLASDLGRQALGGTYKGIGETIRGLGALPQIIGEYTTTPLINAIFGTDYRTSNLLDKPADVVKGYGERLQEGVSEATKEAIKASTPDGDILKPSTWTFGENPSIVGYTALGLDVLGQMFPVLASTIATGGQSAAVRYGATGLLGGAQGGGAAISEAEDIIDQMAGKTGESGKSVLEEQSAFYRELKARGLSDNDALQRTKDAASRVAFILTAPVSGIGGIATARIINPAERILSSRTIAERTLGRAALGGAEEGTQEVTESVQTRRGVNIGAGADVDVTEGSFADFVLGAMGGSVPGAVGGALSSREPAGTTDTDRNVTVRTPPPASGPVSRAMQAGMDDAAARRVVVTAPDGSTVSGFLDAYDDDGQGGFVARVLTDDGLPLTVTSADGVTITPERAAPPALPAPTITVDPAGTATTTEQRQRQTERRQQEDEARRQRRTELGITPDVDRVAQAHRARERLPESLDAGQPISVVTRDGEVIDGTVDAYERTQDGARLTFTDEAGQERSLTQDQFSEINEREASDAKPVDSEQVSDGSASSPTPAGTQRGSKPRKSKADAPRAATSGTSAAEAGGSGAESVAGATGTGDAEPALTPTNRLADMSLDELVEHRKYLSTQARTNNGWTKPLAREKRRVEAAIRKIDPAAMDQFKTPAERKASTRPPQVSPSTDATAAPTPRATDVTTPQGKPLVELFHPASGTHVLVRQDQWEAGRDRLVVFNQGGTRKVGPGQEIERAALAAPVEAAPSAVQGRSESQQDVAQANEATSATEQPAPADAKRTKALERIAKGRAWFSDQKKARDFITKNGLADTHAVEQTGAKRFEVKAKPADEQTIAEGMQVVVVSKRSGNVVERGIYRGDDPRTGSARVEIAPSSISMRHRDNYEIQPIQQAATGDDAGAATTQPTPADKPAAKAKKGGMKPADDRFAGNKIFTADKVAAARARLKSKLNQLNSGIDPEVLLDGITITGAYIEEGVRDFSAYAKAMVDDFGDAIKPYLLSFWEGVRAYPGLKTDGMTPADQDYLDFGGLPDASGAAIRDMTSRYMKYVAHPRHIAALHDEFVPVFKAANDQQHDRNATLEGLHKDYRDYDTLKQESKDRVNRILELGRLVGEVYTDAQLSGGVTNPGFARTVVRDSNGEPHLVRQPIQAALSKAGDVIRLNAREIEAYLGLRRMFDKALDMFRDQALVEFGFGEYAGMDKPLDALRKLVDGKPKTDQKANRIRNVIQFIEDIEQSKRAGYVPFSRYGDYVIAVKERIAALKYRKFGDGYLVRGVTPELDDALERMGAIYDAEEHEWYVTEDQRIELERANERTVYSEKIETGLRDKFGKNSEGKVKRRRAKVENIPSVKAARARIEKEYLDGHSDRRVIAFETTKKRGEGGIDLTALDALAELAQIDNPTWDAVRGELQKALQAGGFRRHFFQSSHVPGYTTDFQRSIADYMVGMSGYLARRRFNNAWDKALADIKGAALHEYAAKYRTYFNDPREEFAALRQAAFVMKISANVSSALVNLTQTFLTTIPTLNQIAGHARVATELTKAAKDALAMVTPKAGTNVFDMSKAPADLREEFAKADAAGLFLPLNSFDLMGQANQRTAAARRTQDVANTATSVISLPFSASERFNRIVAFTAAARLAKRKGLAGKIRNHFKNDAWARESFGRDFTPYDFAEWLAQETQFQMGKINRPTMMRGAGAAMLQFRSFMMQLLEKMYRDWTLHGAAGKVSTISTLAMMIAFSGLWGAPGSDDLRKLLEFLYKQASGKDVDLKDAMRQTIYGATGSMLVTDALSSGIPYYFGLDLSQRVGLGNILPEQYNKTGLDTLDMMTMVGGPGFDILVAAPIRAIGMVSAGNISGAAGELAPVWAKNPMQAYQWQTDAVRTKRGDKVLDRSEIDGVDIALKAIGVQPSRVSRQYEMSSAQFRAQRGSDDAKRALRLDLVRAMERESNNTDQRRAAALRADVDAAIEKIREWNRSAPPDQRISLKPSSVRAMIQRERLGGQSVLQRAPRKSRESALRRAEAYGIGLGR